MSLIVLQRVTGPLPLILIGIWHWPAVEKLVFPTSAMLFLGTAVQLIMAKIEMPSCSDGDNLEKIVELCNGIRVARGDLGVEWYFLCVVLFLSVFFFAIIAFLSIIAHVLVLTIITSHTYSPPEDVL